MNIAMTKQSIEKFIRLFVGLSIVPSFFALLFAWAVSVKFLGIDMNESEGVIAWIALFMGFPLAIIAGPSLGCLVSYCIVAKFFKVPRSTMEEIIEEVAAQDPMERAGIVQRYYQWCLNVAYR